MTEYGRNRNWRAMPTAWGGILPYTHIKAHGQNMGSLGAEMEREQSSTHAVFQTGSSVNFIKIIRYENGWLSFMPPQSV